MDRKQVIEEINRRLSKQHGVCLGASQATVVAEVLADETEALNRICKSLEQRIQKLENARKKELN